MENLTRESKPYLSGEYKDIFKASATDSLSNEEVVAYSQLYYKELENRSAVRFAARKSREEGFQEGIEQGREQAINEKAQVARNLGLSEDLISKLFGI